MEVRGSVASDGREPSREVARIAKGVELGERLKEDVLDEIFGVMGRDASEDETVHHTGVPGIQLAEGGAVPLLRGPDKGCIGGFVLGRIHDQNSGVY